MRADPRRTLGSLILGWAAPYQIDVSERAILSTIAGYTGRAVERALYLDDRITVARQLQQAMLTDLPATPGLRLGDITGHDMRAAAIMADSSRSDRERIMAPGATLLLYTDGLVEKRGADTSLAIDQAAGILAAAPSDQPLPDLLQTVLGEVAGPSSREEIVLPAVQVPAGQALRSVMA